MSFYTNADATGSLLSHGLFKRSPHQWAATSLRSLFRREGLEAMGIQREPYWLATFKCSICEGCLTLEIIDAKVIETLEQRVQDDKDLAYIRVYGHEAPF